jgi:alpha-D-ribose 1-methylphosphonate 5-triphosphate synthase subunit PhnH
VEITPPPPLDCATVAVLLTLVDFETPLWLDCPELADYLRFHCGCPIALNPEQASFALITNPPSMPPLAAFCLGDEVYPDRSTTVILQLPALQGGAVWRINGPGLREPSQFAPSGVPPLMKHWLQDNHALFPRGVDVIFTGGVSLACLPRSTRLEN